MTIQDLIDKLPPDVQARVRQELQYVTNLPIEAAQRFISYYQNGEYRAAYKLLVSNMSGDQLDLAMEETNARMKAAKQRVSNEKARLKSFVDFIVQALLSALAAWLQAQTV